ncbi:MAG: helix-turn-helix transcriptional regulator [Selenomonadaceae bacterium]|jgi:ribosome-binding protein aMBF1 (putative translation factor)|nr:helix-turn-helix domain-containing protein [Selenomonadaceae bacterium]MDD6120047.1 helix-turn-helix transcriptional regulator [Selenomonadaceae bacterium]MDD7055814.1 helix-turn-helix transcriptional regulator [Selenomonadaceae bacterium]MDY3915965.1 helix-turn-helix transcriptional regulator [Selenomonadaceae bacterium]
MMSNKFNDFLKEQLQDEEFRREYEALQPEHAVIQAMIDARKRTGLTQKELSERTGIAQGDISKLERGNANPSLRTLKRLAAGMGMQLKIEFVPEAI